ncbi:MAG: hypothetical protein R2800_14585 [Flavipsychrobacter sp.]
MRHLHKFIEGLIFATLCVFLLSSFRATENSQYTTPPDYVAKTTGSPKLAALTVLRAKCNVCHKKQNKKKVFTLDNMNTLAPKINRQVFIKKRMPKGKDITLTQQEYAILKTWLFTQNIK